jgi:WD40 repeat protein
VQVPLLSGLETDEGFGLSADGSRLVYARAPYYSNLWLVEADEDSHGQPRLRQTQLTDGTSVVERPHISPDGALILFSMGYESRANLYTIPATGGIPKQLTFLNAFSVGGVWSPDGRTVAFASTEGGNARVWTVNADGSSPRPVPSGDLSESYDLAWAPGNNLLYQQTNNRNFYVIDPHTAQQRLLIEDSSVGWVGAPSYSPDAKRMAIWWNRRPGRGIWLFESGDWSHRLLLEVPNPADPPLMPIGWSSDGAAVYVWLGNRGAYRGISVPLELTTANARVVKLPVSGGPPETIVSLPFDEVGSVAAFPDGRRFVASVYSSRSDIWVVDNFDSPSASARLR